MHFPLADVERSVGKRFAAQVRQYGDRVALRTRSATLSYRELDTAARRIAGRLIERLGPEEAPVLLLLKDDVRFVSAFLAGLQAGKICVPVDPHHPLPWLTTIWRDTGARVLVTETQCLGLARQIAGDARQILAVDDSAADACDGLGLPEVSPNRLACILYTSGSSGAPKGVVYTHRTLLHLVLKTTNSARFSVSDRFSLLAARGTAAELTGIFATLLIGAELHPFQLQQAGLSALASWIREQEITVWRLTASTYRHSLEGLRAVDVFPSLRHVRLGGEPATRRDLELCRRHFLPGCVLSNAYATTETGLICVCPFEYDTPVASHILPVGYPVPDTEVLLVDESGQPSQPGEIGEIIVRSEYLAPGYWQRPDLTAAAFLPDPEGGRRRLYRTGDLGRLAPDGCLEHLGRRDFQVKVRGYRVELAELEAALLQAPAVKAAAVAAHEDGRGENRLVGYVVPTSEARPTTSALRAFLKERLPDHMVPGAYVVLDRLPTTGAGKLDRGALRPPAEDSQAAPRGEEPRNHLEAQLAGIWAEMLKRPRIGFQEDFFDLGGDSLLATQMLLRVEQDCGCRVDPGRVLSSLTIERLVTELLAGSRETLARPVVQIQSGTSRTPFFFLHGDLVSGGFYCRRLARALGPEVTMYAVQPHGLGGTALPDSIEQMAAERLQSIREIQATGPYSLGGFCGGGIIAYEIARQLRARGERVATVLLIDAQPPNLAYRSYWTLTQRLGVALRLSLRIQQALFVRLKWYREDLQASGRAGLLGWTVLLWGKLKSVVLRAMASGVQSGATPDQGAGAEPPSLLTRYQERMSVYMPGPFSGRVALFRSSYRSDRPAAAAGWDMLTAGEDLHRVPGTHHTCVTTHASDLAARMRPYLQGSNCGPDA